MASEENTAPSDEPREALADGTPIADAHPTFRQAVEGEWTNKATDGAANFLAFVDLAYELGVDPGAPDGDRGYVNGEQVSPPPASVWNLALADQEIDEELRALGVEIPEKGTAELEQSRRDALAAVFLRHMAEERHEIDQLNRSNAAEISFINARYYPQIERRLARFNMLEHIVEQIAADTAKANGYPKKKKSRDVSTGTYGYKSFAGKPDLVDADAFTLWAKTNARSALRVKLTVPYSEASERFTDTELTEWSAKIEPISAEAKRVADAAGAKLPPGFAAGADRDEYYAKPLPAVALPPKPPK